MSNGKTYEMLWDCQFCGTKKNLGLTHRFCPNCGAPQDPDSRYFPSDAEKVEVHDHVYVGVDVTCSNCNELNSAAAEFCGQCGAPLTDAARARTLAPQSRAEGETFESSGSRDVIKEEFDAEMQRIGVKSKPKNKPDKPVNWVAYVGAIVVLSALGVIGVWLFAQTAETQVRVTDLDWERVVYVDEYRAFTEGSWRDSPPSGDNVRMRSGSCSERQRGTRSVPDGETCRTVRTDNGDGTFSESRQCTTNYRQEPVYDDWCTFTGMRWESLTPLRADSGDRDTPYWPQPQLDCEGQRSQGCDRINRRDEHYWIDLAAIEDDNTYRCEIPQSQWDTVEVESVWDVEVRQFIRGMILCDTLAPR